MKTLAFSSAVLMLMSPIQSVAISKKAAADNLIGREFITAFTIVSSTQKIRFLPAVNVFGTRLRLNGQVEYSDGTYRTSRSRELVARLRPKSLEVHVLEAGTEARVLEILRNKKSIDITIASSEDTAVVRVNFGSKYDGYMVSRIGPLLGEEKTVHAQRVAVATAEREAADALVREAELAAAKQAAETAAREKKYEEQQAMMQGKYVDGTYRRPIWMSSFKNQYRHPHAEGARTTRSRTRLIGIEFTLPFDIVTGHYSFGTEVTDSFLLNAYTGRTTRVSTVNELQGGPAGTELVVVPKGTRVRIIEASKAGGKGRSYLKLVTSDSDTVGVIVRESSSPEKSLTTLRHSLLGRSEQAYRVPYQQFPDSEDSQLVMPVDFAEFWRADGIWEEAVATKGDTAMVVGVDAEGTIRWEKQVVEGTSVRSSYFGRDSHLLAFVDNAQSPWTESVQCTRSANGGWTGCLAVRAMSIANAEVAIFDEYQQGNRTLSLHDEGLSLKWESSSRSLGEGGSIRGDSRHGSIGIRGIFKANGEAEDGVVSVDFSGTIVHHSKTSTEVAFVRVPGGRMEKSRTTAGEKTGQTISLRFTFSECESDSRWAVCANRSIHVEELGTQSLLFGGSWEILDSDSRLLEKFGFN